MEKTIKSILAAAVACSAAMGSAQTAITLNESVKYQTIDNFAASDCWSGEFVGRYFSATNREKVAKWLFSTRMDANGNPTGIGLSSWRVNLGAGSAAQGDASGIDEVVKRADCFLQADGSYDWNRCPGQQYLMQKAKEYGVNDFVLFSNSAPVYFTKNGIAHCDKSTGDANLKDDCYDDFAEFLATTAKHFMDEGYNVTHISPVNEPSWDWQDNSQEGSHWTNKTISKLVKELDNSITSRNLSSKILIPEAVSYTTLYSIFAENQINAFWNSSQSNYVGNLPSVAPIAAAHSYWTFGTNYELQNSRTSAWSAAQNRNLKIWQTEWSLLDTAPSSKTGFPEGGYDAATHTDIALFMAKVIQCDLVYANVSSWSYWTALAQEQWGHKNRFYLIRVNASGDTGTESYGDLTKGGSVTDDMSLWALGNFSLFIRPGYQRVDMTGADEINGLLGSSYVSPDGKQLVMVIVNTGTDERTITLAANGRNLNGYTINKYVTDKGHRLRRELTLDPNFTGDAVKLSARSITTITLDAPEMFEHGDVNGDGSVDITDVNTIANILLGNDVASKYDNRADVNTDGIIDITDINALINIILH